MTVEERLQAGRFGSGITSVELDEQAPDRFRIDQRFGPTTDVWVLFGRRPLDIRSNSVRPAAFVCRCFHE